MDMAFFFRAFPQILAALPITLGLAVSAGLSGWVFGFLIALIRAEKVPVLSHCAALGVSFFRGVPMVVLLYVSYYTLPQIITFLFPGMGINRVPAFLYALFALGCNQVAYSSEIFRAALDAVPAGQREAARSINMTSFQAMVRITLPQALVVALPNMGNMFLGLVQETSLAFYVGVVELMSLTHRLADSGLNFLEGYVILTLIYEALSLLLGRGFRALENRLSRYRWRPELPRA
jgi:L-cystine transport system permease protein